MEATLKWEKQRCVNPPPPPSGGPEGTAWELKTILGPGWVYQARLVQPDEAFVEWVPELYRENYPTERAAQLACEAALWLLGIMPLPPWVNDELRCTGWYAFVSPTPSTEWYWGARSAGGTNNEVEGYASTRELATAAASAHLRVQIAIALDIERAKEKR